MNGAALLGGALAILVWVLGLYFGLKFLYRKFIEKIDKERRNKKRVESKLGIQ